MNFIGGGIGTFACFLHKVFFRSPANLLRSGGVFADMPFMQQDISLNFSASPLAMREQRQNRRLTGLKLLAEGWSISDVARYFNTSPSTVHYWKSKKTSETADARYKLDWMAFQTSWVLHPEMSLADLAELHGVTYQTARYAANALGLKR